MEKCNLSVKMLSATIPNGFTVIDTVTTQNHPIGAVLLQNNETGIYCLLNSGIISSVDQKETAEYLNA